MPAIAHGESPKAPANRRQRAALPCAGAAAVALAACARNDPSAAAFLAPPVVATQRVDGAEDRAPALAMQRTSVQGVAAIPASSAGPAVFAASLCLGAVMGVRKRRVAAAAAGKAGGDAKVEATEAGGVKVEAGMANDANVEKKKEPFDVFKPDTYGNITMDDVKKYGTAGTVSYVVTELIFWAIAFPTEFAIFYNTAGRWPDLNNDIDKATVLGFVFAASNVARLCLPLRFGAALAMAPWVDENIIARITGRSSIAKSSSASDGSS